MSAETPGPPVGPGDPDDPGHALPAENDALPAEDDALPAEDDASWSEITAQTLRLVRQARAGHRRARLREQAYTGYLATLAVLIYVAPSVARALQAPAAAPRGGLPPGFVPSALAVALVVLVALVRDGQWRGPVLLDQAATAWLLPLPLRREALLRPRLRAALLTAGALGAGAGAVGGVLLRLVAGGSAVRFAAAGALAGGTVLVLGTALAALVEAADDATRRALRRGGAGLWALPAAPLALLITPDDAVSRVLRAVWPALLGAGLAAAVTAAVLARRRITRVTNATLRSRAAAVTAVTQALGTLQPRRARMLVETAQGRAPRTRWRLPVPRHRALLVPWRDATAVLRSPARLVWAVLWTGAAMPLLTAAGAASGSARFALAVTGLGAGYLAAAQLAEGARLDADDPRTARSLPLGSTRLALGHLTTPIAGLAVAAGPAAGFVALAGPPSWQVRPALVLLLAAIPALAGAALVSAFRGEVPLSLMVTPGGATSPAGDPGPVLVLLWYVRGPLAAVLLLLPAVLGAGPGAVPGAQVLAGAAAGAVMAAWASGRARRVLG
jgi:hypothetical protein